MTSRPAPMILVAVALAGMLTGCAPASEPSPTTTSTFADEAQAFAAAEETYRAYVDALNAVDLSDPATFEDVYAWTTGELNASDRETFTSWTAEGYSKTGAARIKSVSMNSFDQRTQNVTLDACYDVADVDVLDSAGKSLVDPSRPDIQVLEISFEPSSTTSTRVAIASIDPGSGGTAC